MWGFSLSLLADSDGLCTTETLVKVGIRQNLTPPKMDEISLKRDEIIAADGKPFCEDPDNDFWMANQAIAQCSKRLPIFTSHLCAKLGEFYRIGSRGSMIYAPYSGEDRPVVVMTTSTQREQRNHITLGIILAASQMISTS